MLQAKFLRSYPSKSGNIKAVYTLSGSPAELDAYKKHQGSYIRFAADGTTPLIFGDCPLNQGRLYQVSYVENIGYFVDFNEITAAAGSIETADRKGNALLAAEVAKQQAQQLMGNSLSSAASAAFDEPAEQAQKQPAAKPSLNNPIKS
jgi:hypothetical protein